MFVAERKLFPSFFCIYLSTLGSCHFCAICRWIFISQEKLHIFSIRCGGRERKKICKSNAYLKVWIYVYEFINFYFLFLSLISKLHHKPKKSKKKSHLKIHKLAQNNNNNTSRALQQSNMYLYLFMPKSIKKLYEYIYFSVFFLFFL